MLYAIERRWKRHLSVAVGRNDLRIEREKVHRPQRGRPIGGVGALFQSAIPSLVYCPQVVPTHGYWEATLSASLLPWPVIRGRTDPTATERRRFQRLSTAARKTSQKIWFIFENCQPLQGWIPLTSGRKVKLVGLVFICAYNILRSAISVFLWFRT